MTQSGFEPKPLHTGSSLWIIRLLGLPQSRQKCKILNLASERVQYPVILTITFFPLNSRMWHDRPSSCPAPLSKHTGKEFNFRSMPKIWEASQQIIIITILMYAEIIVCTINQLFIYRSRSTGISYGSCEKGPLDCEDARSNISKTSEGYLKVFVVSTSADARSNAVYNNQISIYKNNQISKTQMRWLIYIFTSRF